MTQLFKIDAHSVAKQFELFIEAKTEEEARLKAVKILPSMVTAHIDNCTPSNIYSNLLKKDEQVQP
jgi:hypothetical protein